MGKLKNSNLPALFDQGENKIRTALAALLSIFTIPAILTALLFGCLQKPTETEDLREEIVPRGSISGRVVDDETGAGISGVSVTTDSAGFTTTTDSTGSYKIPDVLAGVYRLTYSHSFYKDTTSGTIRVNLDEDIDSIITRLKKDHSQFRGSVSGYVADSNRSPVADVHLILKPSGKTGLSNAQGFFLITDISAQELQNLFAYGNFTSDTLIDIRITAGDTLVLDTLQVRRSDVTTRNISGKLEGDLSGLRSLTATISGDGIDSTLPLVTPLIVDKANKNYSAFIHTSKVGGQWFIKIQAFDSLGRLIGLSDYKFDRLTGDIVIPAFNPRNSMPTAHADADPAVSINDTIHLKGSGKDTLNGSIVKLEWDIGATGAFKTSKSGDTAFIAPDTSGVITAILRVTDNDGNTDTDKITIDIKQDIPIASARASTPIVSINDSVHVKATAADKFGKIVKWEWDIGNTGVFIDVTPDSNFSDVAPGVEKPAYVCVLRVTDDDGNTSSDTVTIEIKQDPPVPSAFTTTKNVSINDSIHLKATATDKFGKIIKWEWDIGNTGVFTDVTPDSNLSGVAPGAEKFAYICVLRVTDDDGNTSSDKVTIEIKQDPPSAGILTDTTRIRVDSQYTLKTVGSNSGDFGTIVKYEWSIGSYSNFVEGSGNDTVLTAPANELENFPVVLRITDDDALVAMDTILLKFAKDWDVLGNPGFTPSGAVSTSIVMYNNIPHVAFGDKANGEKVSVMKYDADNWVFVGPPGFTIGDIGRSEIGRIKLTHNNGALYVLFKDGSEDEALTLMKNMGNQWFTVGKAGFSIGRTYSYDLAFKDNIPYVAYEDNLIYDDSIIVMKFNGSEWENIEAPGVYSPNPVLEYSDHCSNTLDLEIYNGTPYLAFCDKKKAKKVSVMKFDGTYWQYVGKPEFSPGKAELPSLAISNNMLYVAFIDGSASKKISAMKFNGTDWEYVGTPGFTPTTQEVRRFSMAVSDGTPFVAFDDWDSYPDRRFLYWGISVMKFNGNKWEFAGSRGFSEKQLFHLDLTIENGIAYLAGFRNDNEKKALVYVLR